MPFNLLKYSLRQELIKLEIFGYFSQNFSRAKICQNKNHYAKIKTQSQRGILKNLEDIIKWKR